MVRALDPDRAAGIGAGRVRWRPPGDALRAHRPVRRIALTAEIAIATVHGGLYTPAARQFRRASRVADRKTARQTRRKDTTKTGPGRSDPDPVREE